MAQPIQPEGYLAVPPSGNGNPVLVLHPWWGLNATIRGVCDRLAAEGYTVFAPDLYHGEVVDTIPAAEQHAGNIFEHLDQYQAEVLAAADYLRDYAGAEKAGLAVVGFSLGAFFALELSASVPDKVSKVVVFYGARPGDYRASQAAYQGHFAENDEQEPIEGVRELEANLKAAGRPTTFYVYEGTGHWFFEPDRADAYDAAASALAWQRTLDFLKDSA